MTSTPGSTTPARGSTARARWSAPRSCSPQVCAFAIGVDGESTTTGDGDGSGGNDVWVNFDEAPDYDGLPLSVDYGRGENQQRYEDRADWLATQNPWRRGTAFTHPDFDEAAFYLADLGVVVLDEPITLPAYGKLPPLHRLNRYQSMPKKDTRFTSVGYGLEKVLPFADFGGDTRRTANQMLVTLKGTMPSLQGTWAIFSGNNGKVHEGGTCFGDSGGPIFEAGTRRIVAVVSFGISPNCTANTGGYRIDQADDLDWLARGSGSRSEAAPQTRRNLTQAARRSAPVSTTGPASNAAVIEPESQS